jgi:large subunit ribosomal protein L20
MARVKGSVATHARRKKILNQAEGYFGSKHILFKTAKEQVLHSLRYAYVSRREIKRDYRKLWIKRINAGCRVNDISYSRFVDGLNKAGVKINRKMLSEMAISDPEGFKALCEQAKKAAK